MTAPLLFSPLTLRGLGLRNRIVLSPMCQYSAVEGEVQDWHHAHHARLALGGLGMAVVEATAVTRDGRITHGCTGLWSDAQVAGLAAIARLYKAHGAVPAIQIGHSGRRGSTERPWDGNTPIARRDGPEAAWQTVGPSALAEKEGNPVPRALTPAEIDDLLEAFRAAAARALAAGFEVVEVHGAHGYLLHSFQSPVSNRREDAYGGTPAKRMRLPLLAAEAVRSVWPAHLPVLYRASVVDGVEGGLTIADSVALARELKARGIDLVDCSSGGMAGPATLSSRKIRPGFQVPLAAAVRQGAGLPTMAVGAIIEARQAEDILAAGSADLIAIGRELMADPNWCFHAALALGLADPYAVLPARYAFYLERRAKVLEL